MTRAQAESLGGEALHKKQGNDWADTLAKKGAALHPDRPEARVRAAKMQLVLAEVLPYFGRCLKLLVDSDWLPERRTRKAAMRVPLLTGHVVTQDQQGGQARCCRCLRLANGGFVNGPCIPQGQVPHLLCSLGEGLFCSVCGAYSFSRTRKLAQACRGHPVAKSGADVYLQRLLGGRHPVTRKVLGSPQDLWAGALDLLLTGDSASA